MNKLRHGHPTIPTVALGSPVKRKKERLLAGSFARPPLITCSIFSSSVAKMSGEEAPLSKVQDDERGTRERAQN